MQSHCTAGLYGDGNIVKEEMNIHVYLPLPFYHSPISVQKAGKQTENLDHNSPKISTNRKSI